MFNFEACINAGLKAFFVSYQSCFVTFVIVFTLKFLSKLCKALGEDSFISEEQNSDMLLTAKDH